MEGAADREQNQGADPESLPLPGKPCIILLTSPLTSCPHPPPLQVIAARVVVLTGPWAQGSWLLNLHWAFLLCSVKMSSAMRARLRRLVAPS